MRLISRLIVPLALLAQFVAPRASADETPRPGEIPYQHCQTLIGEGDYPGALEECQRAYEMSSEPGILVQIAQLETALLRPVGARDTLRRYLRASSLEPGKRQVAERQIRYLETLIATLSVTTRLEGASIRVDE